MLPRALGPKEAVACAKCVVAEAEIALVSRDLGWPAKALAAAGTTLEDHGDRVNAARYLEVRRLVLIGRLDEAERMLAALDPARFPPVLRTSHELLVAGIAMRRLRTKVARLIARAEEQLLLLEEVEALLASKAFIGGACRHVVRDTHTVVSRARLSVVVRARTSSGRSVARRRAEDLPLARAFLRATRSGYDAITCR